MAKKTAQKRPARQGQARQKRERRILLNASAFADLVGVHHNTIGNWLKEGLPGRRRNRETQIDMAAAVPWVIARQRRDLEAELALLRSGLDEDANKAAKVAAEARLKELDLAERQGRLVYADEVEARWSQVAVAVREAMMAVPGQAVQSGIIEPAREAEMDQIVRDALSTLADAPPPASPRPNEPETLVA